MSAGGRAEATREVVRAAAAEVAREDPEQISMFQVPTRFQGARAEAIQDGAERRRGRPEGAPNVATADWRKLLLSRGKSPLQSLMEWSLHSPTTLAAELQCSRLEAFRLLKEVWAELAPYLHGRLAPVDDKGAPVVPFFAMNAPGAQVAVVGQGGRMPWEGPWSGYAEPDAETQQNQALPQSGEAVSHGPLSHGEAKDMKT